MNDAVYIGFADEMAKIAKRKERKLKPLTLGQKAGIGVGAAFTGHNLGGLGAGIANASMQSDIARSGMTTTPEQAAALASKIAPGETHVMGGGVSDAVHIPKGTKMRRGLVGDVDRHLGPNDRLTRSLTGVPTKTGPHIGAHEFGHAAAGRRLAGRIVRKLRVPGMAGAMIAAPAMAAFGKEDGTAAKISPLVGLAGAAPILGEEAYASLKGYKGLKSLGTSSPAALKTGRRQLMKAWGTYGAKLGVPAVGVPLAILGARHLRRRNMEKQEARLAARSREAS